MPSEIGLMNNMFRTYAFLVLAVLSLSSAHAQVIVSPTGVCPEPLPAGIGLPGPLAGADAGPPYEVERGVRANFFPEPYQSLLGLLVFGVEANQPITAHLWLEYIGGYGQTYDSPLTVRFFALLNERFLPINEDEGLYREVVIPYREPFVLDIAVPPLTDDGIYDLVVIAVPNPEVPTGDTDFSYELSIFSNRMTLVVGDPMEVTASVRDYRSARVGIPMPDDPPMPAGANRVSVGIDLFTDEFKPFGEPFAPFESVTFNIELGQTQYFTDYSFQHTVESGSTEYALIVLDDYVPVSISDDGEPVLYARMGSDVDFVEHTLTVTAPMSGVKDLIVVRIDYPDTPLCQYIDGGGVRLYGVRMGIEVN